MAELHMTIDPSFTHIVLDITREKLWEQGNVEAAEKFFEESFGFDNKALIARIIRGEYVMVFNEDGSGNVVPRDEVTKKQQKAMNGLPEYWDRPTIIKKFRDRIYWYKTDLDELIRVQQLRDFHNIRATFDFTIGSDSYKLINDAISSIPDIEFDVNTSLTTRSLIKLYLRAKNDENARKLQEAIMTSDSKATDILYICRDIENQVERFKKVKQTLAYAEMYWEKDIMKFDQPEIDGISKVTPDDVLNHKADKYWIWAPYNDGMSSVLADWQYINASFDDQTVYSAHYVAQEQQAEAEIQSYVDFVARQKEVMDGPVKIDERPWDAGWIAPDGKVWAENGSTANLIHINLADRIFRWMGWEGTDEDSDNRDFKLEKMGWMKFHDREISFAGYAGLRTTTKVTNRQKDRLVEYCKAKNYDGLYDPFSQKHFSKSEIYSMDDDEWRDIFEW